MRKSSSRGEISQFITSRSSINILSILPVRDTTSNAHSRPGLPVSVLASHPMRYATRERDFFPKRQFTVKLLGEAWRILRGVQQVVGCNKLLPTTSGSFHCLVVPPLLVRLSTRIFCASGCARSRIQRTFRDNLVEIWRRRPYKRSILHTTDRRTAISNAEKFGPLSAQKMLEYKCYSSLFNLPYTIRFAI